ncbi:N-formylglutamate amidohydrolase (plasmid) [Rhodococcus qingshengii]|uniref:hypothetical protein n=1 Tax=Rhodococcus TaxID=1827 RepID=UPI0007DB4D92|nr:MULTISPECIES: hypothetical protein [Rhodococcus]AZI66097.1 hypothetical protein EHW12_34350 [Rhodococcus sp. NJ-530]BDQ24143.1 N-formylglutamate amidohydrolase [Rhodococcus qingshengii]
MLTDRALLAARIREAHHLELPSFTTGSGVDTSSTVVAEALATENVTLTAVITSRRFDAPPRRWDPAASGTAVTVTVTSSDSGSGARRHVGLTEPEAWARAMFAEFDEDDRQRIYLLCGKDSDAGRPEHGVAVYRFYLGQGAVPIRVGLVISCESVRCCARSRN